MPPWVLRRRGAGCNGDAGDAFELLELIMIGAAVAVGATRGSSSDNGPGLGSTSPQSRSEGDGTCLAVVSKRGEECCGVGGTVRQRDRQSAKALASLDT